MREVPQSCAASYAPLVARCPRLELTVGEGRASRAFTAAALLLVEEGIAVIVNHREDDRRAMVVAIARAGDVLAPPRETEELAALTDVVLTVVPVVTGRALLASSDIAAWIVERLVDAVSERQESLSQFAVVDRRERIRMKLLQLARAHGRVATDGVHLDLPLTHALLAQTTGSARETVTSALVALQQQGFLVREGRCYRLTIPADALADGG